MNSFPVRAQDIVSTSEDLTNLNSVFVFRQSRKAPQARSSNKNKSTRSTAQRTESRKKIQAQVAANLTQRPRTSKVTTPPPTTGGAKTASREQASKALAGAAETFLDDGDLINAIEYFKKALELDPKNNPAKLGLSEAYVRRGDQMLNADKPENALYFYDEALKGNPNNAAAYAGQGESYDTIGNNEKALAAYEKAIALDANLTEIFAPLGILYFQKGEIAKAEDYLSRIRAIRPDDPETEYFYGLILAKQNRNDEAIAAFQRSIAKNSTAEAHLNLGEAYDRADRDKDAIAEYQEAIRLNANYPEAYYNLGVTYFNRGKFLDAANAYQEAVKLRITYGEARANLAETYRQLGLAEKDPKVRRDWFSKAVSAYAVAGEFVKDDTELYSNYGILLGILGRWMQATEVLKKAVTPQSDATDYTNLGWAYYNASQEDKQKSDIAAAAKNAAAAQAAQATRRQKLIEARTYLEKAVSLDNKFAYAYLNLGIVQSELDDNAGSITSLQTAIKLRKNWALAHNELGVAYFQSKKYAEAAEQFKNATEINDKYVGALFMLARSEHLAGRPKEAKKAQEKLLKLNPNMAKQLELYFRGVLN